MKAGPEGRLDEAERLLEQAKLETADALRRIDALIARFSKNDARNGAAS